MSENNVLPTNKISIAEMSNSCTDNDLEMNILLPYTHLLKGSGKQGRKRIIAAFNHWLQTPDDKIKLVLDYLNMALNSSLMIDDIQDNTDVRRGIPAAHCIYGQALTINAACQILFSALSKSFQIDPRLPEILSREILNAFRGQGMEIYWRDTMVCPTEDQYYKMIDLKTGSYFQSGYQCMQLFSDNKTDFSKLVLIMGRYFQIRDDYCNLMYPEELEEWPKKEDYQDNSKNTLYCEDITEGKFSLPVIHALQQSEGAEILNILRLRTKDVMLKKYFVSLLKKLGSLNYTRNILEQLNREARMEITKHGGNPKLENLLDELHSWKK